jgi:Cd2+/Zn2+-exporting ATPase
MALKPDTAVRLRNGERETVSQRDLRPGDVIEVDNAQLHQPIDAGGAGGYALAGFTLHRYRFAGQRAFVKAGKRVQLSVISEPGDSAIDRILKLIEEAEERRAPIERFIDRFSRIYTPAIMVVALLVAIVL